MTQTRLISFAAALVALALAGCGSSSKSSGSGSSSGSNTSSTTSSASSGSTSGGGKSVSVSETDFKLTPSNASVGAGTVTIAVKNDGQTTHALEVEGKGTEKKTGDIAPGASATLTVTLKKGTYEWYCPIDGHKQLGMKGTITVS